MNDVMDGEYQSYGGWTGDLTFSFHYYFTVVPAIVPLIKMSANPFDCKSKLSLL